MYRNINNSNPTPSASQAEPEDLSPDSSSPSSSYFPSSIEGGHGEGRSWTARERLLRFCDIVLNHTNYPHAFGIHDSDEEESSEEAKSAILVKNESRISASPLNSVGESAVDSLRSGSSITGSEVAELEPDDYDKEAYESVSCWCGQPYAGRAMIECDRCLIWFHMNCEQVEEGDVPKLFHCKRCRSKKKRHRPSTSSRKAAKKKRLAPTSASGSADFPLSDASPPLLKMEQVESEEMPSPERQDEGAETHRLGCNGVGNGPESFSPSCESPAKTNGRSSKKRGRKKSASGVNNLTGTTSISSSQLGLKVVDVGESGQSVPSTISQPPPLLPCYVVNDMSAATPETQRLGHHATMNGDSNGISPSQPFPSIPVLEPQVVDLINRFNTI